MKSFKSVFAGAAFLLSAVAANAQDSQNKPSEIAVSGSGEERVAPDKAIVLANVVTNAPTAGAAAAENSRRVAAVIAKLREAGVAANQITNGAYTIGQEFANGDRDKPRGFTARNIIRIEVSSVT